jgi:endonuclease-3
MLPHKLDPDEKITDVIDALRERYGFPQQDDREPLEVLIRGVLSQNTSDINSGRAYERLTSRFESWEAVRRAEAEEVESAIEVGGLAAQKTATIQAILQWLHEKGSYSLDHLKELSALEAEKRLKSIKGIGVKTARLVLLFAFGMPVFVVDTHVLRVSRRLGLVGRNCGRVKAHTLLDDLVPDDRKYPAHINMIRHGRELCHPSNPECEGCPVERWCVYAHDETWAAG